MAFYTVNHHVSNFDNWKKVYKDFESTRNQFNVKEYFALQSVEDANHVMVVAEGELTDIQRFINSEELKNGMAEAGLTGPPEIFIGENRR